MKWLVLISCSLISLGLAFLRNPGIKPFAPSCRLLARNDEYKPNVIFVLGGPGAGKGTQCEKLSDEFGIIHLSAGDLLREERANPDSQYGKLIDTYIKEGKIVPVEISLGLLRNAIESFNCNRYLVDGFPRNFENLEGWYKLMVDVAVVEKVFFFDCDEDELEKRLLKRGLTSGRTDDNKEAMVKRFTTFKESTMPVVKHFGKLEKTPSDGMLLSVDGNQSVDDVYSIVRSCIVDCIKKEIATITSGSITSVESTSVDVDVVSGKSAVATFSISEESRTSVAYHLGPMGWTRLSN